MEQIAGNFIRIVNFEERKVQGTSPKSTKLKFVLVIFALLIVA